ncbi:MAG: hypothetical protein WC955_02310 [Elusimicrobiota bacterium]
MCIILSSVTTTTYAPRDGAGALVFKGKMWLIGGWNPHNDALWVVAGNNMGKDVWKLQR